MSRCMVVQPSFTWESKTFYKATISWRPGNPPHQVIIYSGFLNNGWPCGYNKSWQGGTEQALEFANDPKVVISQIEKLFTED